MKYRIFITGLFALFLTTAVQSQYLQKSKDSSGNSFLTGSLTNDFVVQANRFQDSYSSDSIGGTVSKRKYSPLTVGLLSAVVPGAGQFYTKNYWQSAAFFGAEVLTWVVYAAFEKQGNQRTDAFQQFADAHWSAAQYANWMNINYGQSININPDQSLKSWQRVNWNDLNNAESNIEKLTDAQGVPNTGFTHNLAPYGDQQYYEMIGKYSQFGGGWDDAVHIQKQMCLQITG